LSGQAPYPTTGKLLLFNGRSAGKPVLFGHIYASKPFATSFVITFKIAERGHGTLGTVLSASLPEALGNWGYVTGIEMKLPPPTRASATATSAPAARPPRASARSRFRCSRPASGSMAGAS